MSTTEILNGGARAAVALAEAAGSELEPAAAAITDTMSQFDLTVKDLPTIINQITGAVNESKFSFEDFSYGMAQGGGVAASAGVEFEDFAAALAATSSQFSSGQDAGTSMKTFLLSLTPATKKARKAFEEADFSAYNANGSLKSMAQIAGDLALKFGHLSEQDLNATFKEMFGTDAIRTAIGLMKQGEAGIVAMQTRIGETDAAAQAAMRMKGFNAEMEKLGGAVETAAIAIADSGMLTAITGLVTGFAGLVDKLGELSPSTLKWVTIVAALAAALGPLVIVLGSAISAFGVMLPLIVKMGPAFMALKTIGLVMTPVLWGITKALAAMALTPLGAFVLAIGAVYLAYKNWDKIGPIVQRMYSQVKTWVLDKLNAVWTTVKQKIDSVKDAFFNLYDAVVGHSYIPDMVDGIAATMDRLDKAMVQPAKAATTAAGEAFRALTADVAALMDRLFPEAAAWRKYRDELATIDAALAKHVITLDQATEARKRLGAEGLSDVPILDGADQIDIAGSLPNIADIAGEIPDLAKVTEATTAEMVESFSQMANSAIGSVRGMVDAFRSGDILGGIQGLLDVVVDVIAALGSIGVFKGGAPAIAGARANGGPVSAGKTYLVGERGPEFITPRRGGFVHPNGSGGGGSRVEVIPSPYFNVVVDGRAQQVAAPMATRAAMMGAAGGAQATARQAQRRIP